MGHLPGGGEGYAAHGTFPVTKIKAPRSDDGCPGDARPRREKMNGPDGRLGLATERTKRGAPGLSTFSLNKVRFLKRVLRYDWRF